jgi:antitoxin protein of toxin-antitoxin system
MGIFDKAKDALGDNIEQVDAGIDKAADFVDDKTGDKYREQVDQGAEFVKDKLEEFANDSTTASASDTPTAPAEESA